METVSNLDKKLLIHVALEVVVVGGISYYLYNRQNTMIEELKKENMILAARLKKIENFLENAFGGQPPQDPNLEQPSHKKKKKKHNSPSASAEELEFKSDNEQDIEI